MKTLLVIGILLTSYLLPAQSIVGKWQLMKQSTCMEDELTADEAESELLDDMKSRSGSTTQVIQFKDNNTAEENTKIVNKRKAYNSKSMLYKFTGTNLHILDKKSQTIIDSFSVEQLTADSLIISNTERACETKVFVKIK
jgi:hypothetical protein